MMTKRDYELLARTLGGAEESAQNGATGSARVAAAGMAGRIMSELCAALAADNPRFNRERFMRAWVVAGVQRADMKGIYVVEGVIRPKSI
jgi:hypothetical protein